MDDVGRALARSVREAREARGLSPQALADLAGVSRAMVVKVERGASSPTAQLLARLSGALGLSLSELIARSERPGGRVARRDDQPVWVDPTSGYRRRAISPPSAGPLELVEVELPASAEVPMPAATYEFLTQQIWVLEGRLRFDEGGTVHDLRAGDCLELGAPADCVFRNPGARVCRYVVALAKRVPPGRAATEP